MNEVQNFEVMTVDPPLADQLERWCENPPSGPATTFMGRGNVVFDEEVHFLDKHFMVVQVVASEEPDKEPCWTQGILFNEQGREVGMTDVGEEFLGEYQVGNYCVTVEKEDG
jgi:hypothetical protein